MPSEYDGTSPPQLQAGHAAPDPEWQFRAFVADDRAPPGTRRHILSIEPWSQKHTLSAKGTRCPLLPSLAIRLPKLHVEGSSPFARSTEVACGARLTAPEAV